MFLSMRGRYFAWTGFKGIVSIWDIVAGQQAAFIPLQDDYSNVYANMSRDGSMVVVSAKGRVSLYQTFSGVKLGDYEPGLGDESYFEVVLEREHLMVLDYPCSDLNDLDMNMIGCRRLVSTRDMTVTKTLRIHQDYEVQYPVPVANPAFAYAQVSRCFICYWPFLTRGGFCHSHGSRSRYLGIHCEHCQDSKRARSFLRQAMWSRLYDGCLAC
jgi:hypothetical protein